MSAPLHESNAQLDSDGINTRRSAKRRKTRRRGDVPATWDFRAHIKAVNSKRSHENPPIRGKLTTSPKRESGMSFLW